MTQDEKLDIAFFSQFECRRKLEMYAAKRISLAIAIEGMNSAIAGYLIGDKNKPVKLTNLINCRDWLQGTVPSPESVKEWLGETSIYDKPGDTRAKV
jgi:hypothetical protein